MPTALPKWDAAWSASVLSAAQALHCSMPHIGFSLSQRLAFSTKRKATRHDPPRSLAALPGCDCPGASSGS